MRPLVANSLWALSCTAGYRRFAQALQDPVGAQHGLLRRYLRRNAETVFGCQHNFTKLRSVTDFQGAVPLGTYDDFAPWIHRIQDGQQNVLTADQVLSLTPTSGSTSGTKLIPFTRELQKEFNRAIAPWMFDLYRRDPSLLDGPAYWSITPVTVRNIPRSRNGPPVGFAEDSEYLGKWTRCLVDAALAVPGSVSRIADLTAFRYITLLHLLRATRLRLVSVWHPSFWMLLVAELEKNWDSLLADLHDGTVKPPTEVRSDLNVQMHRSRPMPHRSQRLARISPTDPNLWPYLRLVSCWADANAAAPAADLAQQFPKVLVQPKGLIATEGIVTIPFRSGFPLAIRSHFFEFRQSDGRCVTVAELEKGGQYTIVVTTAGGLYRYHLGDRVVVGQSQGQTPTVRFLGRDDLTSDLFGEKLTESFVAGVIETLRRQAGGNWKFSILAPQSFATGTCYVLIVETGEELPDNLAVLLDEQLRLNFHYDYCRSLGQLLPAQVCKAPPQAYERYSEHLRRKGNRLGELKPLALNPGLDISRVVLQHLA